MSTFSHTDWTVICDYEDEGGTCGQSERSDTLNLRDGTATEIRSILKRRGWAVAVPTGRERRADFCPEHKTAGLAQIEEAGR